MKTTLFRYVWAALPLLAVSCQDEWTSHYDTVNPLAGEGTLWQAMKDEPDLSNFVQLVENVGYTHYFDGDRVFTVFAPTNDCLTLDNVDSLTRVYREQAARKTKDNDNTVIKQFLQNHMAMYNYSANMTPDSVQLTLLNGKYGYLADGAVSGVPFITRDRLYRNGLLHTIGRKLPYFPNVSEYFGMDADLDSVATFFDSYNVYEFDASRSVPGELVDGKTVYLDSVMNLSNVMFYDLGLINREDSAYWMVVPTDEVWRGLYDEYKAYYNYDNMQPRRDSLQEIMTHKAILGGAVFNMNLQPSPTDSVISTYYNKNNHRYYKSLRPFDEGGVFHDAEEVVCSNGRLFKAGNWAIDKRTTFFQEIKIEAEDAYYQDSIAKCKEPVSIMSVPASNPFAGKVSNNTFVMVEPRNTAVTPLIRYTIPDVLSNIGYDIYAVFVPAIAADTLATDTLPLRVRFSIRYNDQEGKQTLDTRFENPATGTTIYETKPGVVDTILVASDYRIPTCSYGVNEPQVRFTVESNNASLKRFTRTLRLDCILFKPHEETDDNSND